MSKQQPVIAMELYLIRHGETSTNVFKDETLPICETEDPILTDNGKNQAEKLGAFLKNIKFDAVYSSCLKRTVITAGELLKYYPKMPLLLNPLFSEVRTPLSYRGTGIEELRRYYEFACFAPEADLSEGLISGNENDTDCDIQKRVKKAFEYLTDKYKNGEKIAVVFHAGLITHFIFYLLGFKESLPQNVDIEINNTGITKITIFKHGTNKFGDIVLDYINSTEHLHINL